MFQAKQSLERWPWDFRELGQRGSCRKMPKGVKPVAYIYVLVIMSLQRKNGSQDKHRLDSAWSMVGEKLQQESFPIIGNNIYFSQCSKQDKPDKTSPPACNYRVCMATHNNRIFTRNSRARQLAASIESGHWWSKRRWSILPPSSEMCLFWYKSVSASVLPVLVLWFVLPAVHNSR